VTSDAKQQVAAQRVKDLRVVAPFAGTIAERYVSPGAFVKVGDPLFDFVSSGALRLALEVPEQYLGDVQVGTRLRIEPRDAQGEGAEAEIVRTSPALNAQTRTLRVEASVDAEGTGLRPGSCVLSTIALGVVSDAMQLPRTAVYSTLGQDRVTLVDANNKVVTRDVDLVGEADGFAYVRGVKPDERVISQGGASHAPNSEVRVSGARAMLAVPDTAPATPAVPVNPATPVPGAVPSAAP
jgi:RND family efflux transporter MFP subunit